MRCINSLKALSLLTVLLGIALLVCNDMYNPYQDYQNADVIIQKNTLYRARDTVEIFKAETLQLQFAVRNLVDSVRIYAPKNRYFSGPGFDTLFRSDFLREPETSPLVTIRFSFYDTGHALIKLATYRSNGDSAVQQFSIYVKSPLSVKPVSYNFSSTAPLGLSCEKSVFDPDVRYHWSIGSVQDTASDKPFINLNAVWGYSGSGQLWVTDTFNAHASPRKSFTYSFSDTTRPAISIVGASDSSNDTIATRLNPYNFNVTIDDPVQRNGLWSVSVNGKSFDQIKGNLYGKQVMLPDNFKMGKAIFQLSVTAIDDSIYKNKTIKSFYLRFDTTTTSLSITTPSGIGIKTSNPDQSLAGVLRNSSSNDSTNFSIQIRVKGLDSSVAHDSLFAAGPTFSVSGIATWDARIRLSDSLSGVTVYALHNTTIIDSQQVVYVYNPAFVDSIKPAFVSITVGGHPMTSKMFLSVDSVSLDVIAFDEGSGVESVWLNEKALTPSPNRHLWSIRFKINHTLQEKELVVKVSDKAKLSTTTAPFTVTKNTPPRIKKGPHSPVLFFRDSTYLDTIVVENSENDPISFYVDPKTPPSGLTIAADDDTGIIRWKPEASQKAYVPYTVRYVITDGYGNGSMVIDSFVIACSDTNLQHVKLKTIADSFPGTLIALQTELSVVLSAVKGTGAAPIRFSALKLSGDTLPMFGDTLRWTPDLSDTGNVTLVVKATDRTGAIDTIMVPIQIVTKTFQLADTDHRFPDIMYVEHDSLAIPLESLILKSGTPPINFLVFRGPDGTVFPYDNGILKWTPAFSDTGTCTFKIKATDLTNASDSLIVPIRVSVTHVRLSTTPINIKDTIVATRDSIKLTLTATPKTGTPPITFSASKRPGDTIVPVNGNLLKWVPSLNDTGLCTLVVRATDAMGVIDDILKPCMVIPPNRPCSLSVAFSGTTLEQGYFDCSTGPYPKAVTFTVHDPDPAARERHNYQIRFGIQTEETLNEVTRTFSITIPFSQNRVFDTLTAIVSDSGGFSDTLTRIIYYGASVNAPTLGSPSSAAIGVDTTVTLTWNRGTTDNFVVEYYSVYLKAGASFVPVAQSLSGTSFTATGLLPCTDYTWYVVASDGVKATATSSQKTFKTRPYFKKVYINTTAKIDSSVYQYPLMIRLNNSNFNFAQSTQNGRDVRFRKANGTPLSYDLELWDSTAQSAVVWVKVDTVKGNDASQYITMHWGERSWIDSSNSRAVFDTANGFVSAWHLNNTPNSLDGDTIRDYTFNAYNGTSNGSMDASKLDAGVCGKGLRFNGSDDYVDFGDQPKFALGQYTFSFWINGNTTPAYPAITYPISNAGKQFQFSWDNANALQIQSQMHQTAAGVKYCQITMPLIANTWYQVSGTYNGTNMVVYCNGTLQNTTAADVPQAANGSLRIGSGQNGNFFVGLMDELEISNIARSPSWIKLNYETQRSSSNVVTFGN